MRAEDVMKGEVLMLEVSCLVLLCAGGLAASQQSKAGTPSSSDKFACYGCVAAVKTAHGLLGNKVADEDKVQELFEESARVCAAGNFEEAEQKSWNLPPPETSRACLEFVQVVLRRSWKPGSSRIPSDSCLGRNSGRLAWRERFLQVSRTTRTRLSSLSVILALQCATLRAERTKFISRPAREHAGAPQSIQREAMSRLS